MKNRVFAKTLGMIATAGAMAVLAVVSLAHAADMDMAMRWWNALSPEQMVAALHGDKTTAAQAKPAKKLYADLDADTRKLVDAAASSISGYGKFDSVGAWWESLDCRLMRIAAGDGNTEDPASPYCAHYPGSGAAKIMSDMATQHVNMVGQALLGRSDPGMYP
jgi:hypothetical protein